MKIMPPARRSIAFIISLLLLFGSFINASAQASARTHTASTPALQSSTQTTNAAPGKRPRLVLLIVVDQFRYDYLQRFDDLFVKNGLKRLQRDGGSWTQANYDHTPTYTAPGHATMMTGAWPAETGIVGNDWPDRDAGTSVTSVSDPSTRQLGGDPAETGASPRRLMASTVGDELKFLTAGRSKVIGISAKDRSAILPGGRRA